MDAPAKSTRISRCVAAQRQPTIGTAGFSHGATNMARGEVIGALRERLFDAIRKARCGVTRIRRGECSASGGNQCIQHASPIYGVQSNKRPFLGQDQTQGSTANAQIL